MSLGHVVDQLHDQDSLADSGTAEQTDLASLGVGGQQVDDLDSGDQDLLLHAHVHELGSLGVDGGALGGFDGAPLVDGLADHVDNAAQGLSADGDSDGGASVLDAVSTDQTLGTVHSDGAHGVLSQMLGHLQHQSWGASFNLQGVQDWGQVLVELDVHDGTDNGHNSAVGDGGCRGCLGGIAAACKVREKGLEISDRNILRRKEANEGKEEL